MSFKQIKIWTNSEHIDLLSDILFEHNALSVSIEDQHEGTALEEPIFNEPGMEIDQLWKNSLLTALFEANSDIANIIAQTKLQSQTEFNYQIEEVDDQDWVRLTQSQFDPIMITEQLYIVPSWHQIPNPEAVGIILDPGLAFGTGSHATTFMCLRWLSHNVQPEDSILDYGCGSGILAITAKKLGAAKVNGVDIDPQAIEASIYNAENNQVSVNFCTPKQFVPQTYDIVVANILSNPLRMLAGALASYVKPGGKIVLSGILDLSLIHI
jgi:ribosomal protein L11 methyltransferase